MSEEQQYRDANCEECGQDYFDLALCPQCTNDLKAKIAALELALKEAKEVLIWKIQLMKDTEGRTCYCNNNSCWPCHAKIVLGDEFNRQPNYELLKSLHPILSSSKLGELFQALLEEHSNPIELRSTIKDNKAHLVNERWEKVEALRKECGI